MTDREITLFTESFGRELRALFGERLLFFGLQGSCARGEQTDASDIDVVVIVEGLDFADLTAYRDLLDRNERRDRICGFVAGNELAGWEKSDLLALVLDTRPICGSLEGLCPAFDRADVRRAVLAGACGLYHAASHNYLHARSLHTLGALYKTARFVVRLKHYYQSGRYVSAMRDLKSAVSPSDRRFLDLAEDFANAGTDPTRVLLDWASALIGALGESSFEF